MVGKSDWRQEDGQAVMQSQNPAKMFAIKMCIFSNLLAPMRVEILF